MPLGSLRGTFAVAACGAIALVATPRAHAQSCHAMNHERPTLGASFGLRVSPVVGIARRDGDAIDYEGVGAGVDVRIGRFDGDVGAAAYRLRAASATHVGLGDVSMGARVRLDAGEAVGWRLSLGGRTGLPTGRDDVGLGMGHVMIGPEVRGGWAWSNAFVSGALVYMAALGEHGSDPHAHHHHGVEAQTPANGWVDPHNRSELAMSLGGGMRVGEDAWLRLTAMVGAPIATADGATRLLLIPGATYDASFASFALDVDVATFGELRYVRAIASVSRRWSL